MFARRIGDEDVDDRDDGPVAAEQPCRAHRETQDDDARPRRLRMCCCGGPGGESTRPLRMTAIDPVRLAGITQLLHRLARIAVIDQHHTGARTSKDAHV